MRRGNRFGATLGSAAMLVCLSAVSLPAANANASDRSAQSRSVSGTVKLTSAAAETLTEGGLTATPVSPGTQIAPDWFLMPVQETTTNRSGRIKGIRLRGGLTLRSIDASLQLTRLRLYLGSLRASVKGSAMDQRVKAFDITNLRITKKKVTGTLLVAPGTSSLLNEQFDTYVFSDGLHFARFKLPA